MKKLIIIMVLFFVSTLFAEFNTIIFIQNKEKNNTMPFKYSIDLEYRLNNGIGIGIGTTSGIITENIFYKTYYRDISINGRKYIKRIPYIMAGASYNIRINDDMLNVYYDKIYLTDFFEIETGLCLRFDNIEFNLPVTYKIELNQWTFGLEFVIKFNKNKYIKL